MTDGLLRQRRNLLITCILLWLMKYGGVGLTKFSVAGFDVNLKNPQALTTGLWIGFFYFLFRYFQYFAAEGIEKLRAAWSDSLDTKCHPIIRSIVKAEYPSNHDAIGYKYGVLKGWNWIYNGQSLVAGPSGALDYGDHFQLPIRRQRLLKGVFLAVVDTCFRKSVVTDYLLPFALALGILTYCGPGDWQGSLMRLVLS